ncbi:MAG: inositol monophosphatase family protein [Fodinibius sp.]|nr:inositol monophosphatase family protein [Fodinibius sp.]
MYYAEKGKGSFKQFGTDSPERIFSSGSSKEDELTAVQSRSHGSDKLVDELKEKGLRVKETVPAGSSIKFCLVAEGKADIYPRMGPTMEWDVAAGDAVYRYSAREGVHESPLTYNKPDLKNDSFIVGLEDQSIKF